MDHSRKAEIYRKDGRSAICWHISDYRKRISVSVEYSTLLIARLTEV